MWMQSPRTYGEAPDLLRGRKSRPSSPYVLAVPATNRMDELVFHKVTTRRGLRGVSFRVEGGEVVGIAGSPGSGKSAILALAAGVRDPASGTVLFDSVPASDWLGSGRLGFVTRAAWLLDDLVASVLLAEPDMLLLDDPFLDGDAPHLAIVGTLIRSAASDGLGVLVTSRDATALFDVADRVLVVDRGRLVAATEHRRSTCH